MKFDRYQLGAAKYDLGRQTTEVTAPSFVEKVLGAAGETGELADKFKKIIRDKNGEMTKKDREEVVAELGDVLWYVASVARYMEVPLSEVAKKNLAKLEDRYQRGKLSGRGDHR